MKKGIKKIVSGGMAFVIGMALPLALFIPILFQDDNIIFRAPGSVEISIVEPGRYYLWNNYVSVFEGRSYSLGPELPNGLTFSLTEKDSGSTVPIKSDLSISSQIGNQKKSSIGYFELTNPGQYILKVSGNTEERVFSFGESLFGNSLQLFGGIIIGFLLGFVTTVGGLLLIVFGVIDLIRESKSVNQGVQATR